MGKKNDLSAGAHQLQMALIALIATGKIVSVNSLSTEFGAFGLWTISADLTFVFDPSSPANELLRAAFERGIDL